VQHADGCRGRRRLSSIHVRNSQPRQQSVCLVVGGRDIKRNQRASNWGFTWWYGSREQEQYLPAIIIACRSHRGLIPELDRDSHCPALSRSLRCTAMGRFNTAFTSLQCPCPGPWLEGRVVAAGSMPVVQSEEGLSLRPLSCDQGERTPKPADLQ
jgi:hypothetical protein